MFAQNLLDFNQIVLTIIEILILNVSKIFLSRLLYYYIIMHIYTYFLHILHIFFIYFRLSFMLKKLLAVNFSLIYVNSVLRFSFIGIMLSVVSNIC